MLATAWPGFHKFSRGPSLMSFFTASPASGCSRNFRLDYIELPWVSLNITVGWVRWPRVVIWLRAMLTSVMNAWYHIKFCDREICCRVLWPRVVILSFMAASYVVEFYDHVLWCWVLWPRGMMSSKLAACQQWWVSWSRAKISSELAACQNWWISWSSAKMSRQFKWLQPKYFWK